VDFTKLFVGGALVGTLISSWGMIKSAAWKVCNIFVKKIVIEEHSQHILLSYLIHNFQYSGFYDKTIFHYQYYIRSTKKREYISLERFGKSSILFWSKHIPFYYHVAKQDNKTENSKSIPTTAYEKVTLFYIKGTLDPIKLINNATHYYNESSAEENKNQQRFFVLKIDDGYSSTSVSGSEIINFARATCISLSHKNHDLGFQVNKDKIDSIVLTKNNEELIESAQLWFDNKDWYKRKGVNWKLGWLLYGPPGTGKSSLARAIAELLDIPIVLFKMHNMTSKKFEDQWRSLQHYTPCIVLIEDFDNIFDGRTNIVYSNNNLLSALSDKDNQVDTMDRKGLTFDTFLNCLDGVENFEGIFTIITTNLLDKVDPALLNRPGRIDKVIELTYLTAENKFKLVNKILHDSPEAHKEITDQLLQNPDEELTPAQLQERCIGLALKELYDYKIPNNDTFQAMKGSLTQYEDEDDLFNSLGIKLE